MIKAIIFDLDGTLLYTLEDLKNAANYALNYYGFDGINIEQTKAYIGNGVKKLMQRALKEDGEDKFNDIYLKFTEHYDAHLTDNTFPYDGITELLKELKKRNIKTAVVSNKYQLGVDILINKLFGDLIDYKIGGSENVPLKPNPKMVEMALNYLNVTNNEVLYIGDSDTDMITSSNANIKSVGVSWGYRSVEVLKDLGASYIINTPDELLNIIEKENDYE